MPRLKTVQWYIPDESEMPPEIKMIYFNTDNYDGDIQITPYNSSMDEFSEYFNKYETYGLATANKLWKRIKNRLVYGAVPLYQWDSVKGKWIEDTVLKKYCLYHNP